MVLTTSSAMSRKRSAAVRSKQSDAITRIRETKADRYAGSTTGFPFDLFSPAHCTNFGLSSGFQRIPQLISWLAQKMG